MPITLDIHHFSYLQNSSFFSEQLTAFQVWLAMGSEERSPPEQLPIVLQVTLLNNPLVAYFHPLRPIQMTNVDE